jgi:hypothetical protein
MGRPAPWTLPARSTAIARTCASTSVNKRIEKKVRRDVNLLRTAFFFIYFLPAMAASCADSSAVDGGVSMVVGIGSFGGEIRYAALVWL